jgi:transcriptional regulator with XRE-family HTH domain
VGGVAAVAIRSRRLRRSPILDAVADHAASALGEIIRQQRELAELSMRQFAEAVGISNPYLSQIERGLRAPSEQVLEGIARGLQTSAEMLYARAGLTAPGERQEGNAVLDAIAADPRLSARQRSALREIYEAFIATSPQGRAASRRRASARRASTPQPHAGQPHAGAAGGSGRRRQSGARAEGRPREQEAGE